MTYSHATADIAGEKHMPPPTQWEVIWEVIADRQSTICRFIGKICAR